MKFQPLPQSEIDRTLLVAKSNNGNISAMARELGIQRSTVRYRLAAIGQLGQEVAVIGKVETLHDRARSFPRVRGIHRFLLTSAQNNTHIFGAFWRNNICRQ